jgi:hypothetical protein
MRKQILLFGSIGLLFCVGFSGCLDEGQGINAFKLSSDEVDDSINMTERQINRFPDLKESILSNSSHDAPQKEIDELHAIFDYFDTNIIYYQNECYEIVFWT